jgi:hypothetical protein
MRKRAAAVQVRHGDSRCEDRAHERVGHVGQGWRIHQRGGSAAPGDHCRFRLKPAFCSCLNATARRRSAPAVGPAFAGPCASRTADPTAPMAPVREQAAELLAAEGITPPTRTRGGGKGKRLTYRHPAGGIPGAPPEASRSVSRQEVEPTAGANSGRARRVHRYRRCGATALGTARARGSPPRVLPR